MKCTNILIKSIFISYILIRFTNPTFSQTNISSCPPTIKRQGNIQIILDNKRTFEIFYNSMNIPWAGDGKNPRPVPQWNFSDVKSRLQSNWKNYPSALIFAFENESLEPETYDIIPIPRLLFWCVARENDVVLLSDKVTHHYTSIKNIDRENRRIYFLDPWPDNFFLKEGRNYANVSAKTDSNGISITKDEFDKVIVGLMTNDTKEFIYYFINNYPDASSNPNTLFGLSSTLLESGNPSHIYFSVNYLKKTLLLIDQINQTDLYYKTAQRLAFALAQCSYLKYLEGDILYANQYTDDLTELFSKISPDSLALYYSINDYYKLGNLAGRANDLNMANIYYSEVILMNPEFYLAYLYRALVKFKLNDYNNSIYDATHAVDFITKAIKAHEEKYENGEQMGFIEKDEVKNEINFLVLRKVDALSIRAKAYSKLGKIEESQLDSMEFYRLIINKE